MSYNSILNDSNYFHVTEGLCPDVMHDVLEGVAQYEVKELLNYLINNGVLTLNELNREIHDFPYAYADITDKPTQLSSLTFSDHSLKQKGIHYYFLNNFHNL